MAEVPRPTLDEVRVVKPALPGRRFGELQRAFPQSHFERLAADEFPFYRTTFWYPQGRAAQNVFESVVDLLRSSAEPPPNVVGVEWWFSVLRTNATPQWLLPCHFDRNDLAEEDFAKLKHPERASVLFMNPVPYGELVITDQTLTERGARPRQPHGMRFIRPQRNLYAVFPGHLYHGVIGRLWRPEKETILRVSMAVNWWSEQPKAAYMRDSRDSLGAFGLAT